MPPLRRRPRPVRTHDARMTVIEHLAELRRRVIISLAAVVIGTVIAFWLSNDVIGWLVRYYREATEGRRDALVFTGPTDAFVVRLKVATYGGIVLALPVWLYQLWRFVTPGLHPREKRYAVPFVISALLLFAVGAFVALRTLPAALGFLLNIGGEAQEPLLTSDRYLSLVMLIILGFGLAFEFPVLLTFLLIAGAVSTSQLRRWRRGVIVGVAAFAAIITPSQDPYTMLAMAVPMWVFYEIVILLGRILRR